MPTDLPTSIPTGATATETLSIAASIEQVAASVRQAHQELDDIDPRGEEAVEKSPEVPSLRDQLAGLMAEAEALRVRCARVTGIIGGQV